VLPAFYQNLRTGEIKNHMGNVELQFMFIVGTLIRCSFLLGGVGKGGGSRVGAALSLSLWSGCRCCGLWLIR